MGNYDEKSIMKRITGNVYLHVLCVCVVCMWYTCVCICGYECVCKKGIVRHLLVRKKIEKRIVYVVASWLTRITRDLTKAVSFRRCNR